MEPQTQSLPPNSAFSIMPNNLSHIWKWKSLSCVQLFGTPWPIQSMEFSRPECGMGSLLQGILPTHGLNPGLLHCRQILYQLSHKGSPRILEWVAYPFSSGSSQPRNETGVSSIAGEFFTNWALREALSHVYPCRFKQATNCNLLVFIVWPQVMDVFNLIPFFLFIS